LHSGISWLLDRHSACAVVIGIPQTYVLGMSSHSPPPTLSESQAFYNHPTPVLPVFIALSAEHHICDGAKLMMFLLQGLVTDLLETPKLIAQPCQMRIYWKL
jgi:hypothetical protein